MSYSAKLYLLSIISTVLKQDSEKLNSKAELNMQRNFHLQVYLFCTFPIIIILYFAVVIF